MMLSLHPIGHADKRVRDTNASSARVPGRLLSPTSHERRPVSNLCFRPRPVVRLTRNAVPAPEVNLVRRLPIERAVRKNAIMLVDVEDDQALEGRQVVKLM